MTDSGARQVRRLIVLAILALIIGIPGYLVSNYTSLVIVRNETGAEVNVSVFLSPQPVGAGTIAKDGSAWYIFNPHQDGDFAVSCRSATQPVARTEHVGYAPSGIVQIFRIALGPCGHVKSYSETTVL
jgi:hypothetical protein